MYIQITERFKCQLTDNSCKVFLVVSHCVLYVNIIVPKRDYDSDTSQLLSNDLMSTS